MPTKTQLAHDLDEANAVASGLSERVTELEALLKRRDRTLDQAVKNVGQMKDRLLEFERDTARLRGYLDRVAEEDHLRDNPPHQVTQSVRPEGTRQRGPSGLELDNYRMAYGLPAHTDGEAKWWRLP